MRKRKKGRKSKKKIEDRRPENEGKKQEPGDIEEDEKENV